MVEKLQEQILWKFAVIEAHIHLLRGRSYNRYYDRFNFSIDFLRRIAALRSRFFTVPNILHLTQ